MLSGLSHLLSLEFRAIPLNTNLSFKSWDQIGAGRVISCYQSQGDNRVKKFILGVIIGLIIPAVVGYCYIKFGFAPIATSAQPMPFEEKAAKMIMRAHMTKEMPKNVPMQPTEGN